MGTAPTVVRKVRLINLKNKETDLFNTRNGNRIVKATGGTLLDKIIVNLARAEDDALDLGWVISWNAFFGDDATE